MHKNQSPWSTPPSQAFAMQWATAYGIPMAISHATSPAEQHWLANNLRILFYHYEPDASGVIPESVRVIFPEHSRVAWQAGDYRTASTSIYIAKLASATLRLSAPGVGKLLQKMSIETSQLIPLMTMQNRPGDVQDTVTALQENACEWIKANPQVWKEWIPSATECVSGFGIMDAQGLPVASRAEATQCLVCPAGRISKGMSDELGPTYYCEACDRGFHQSTAGQTACFPCDPGTFAPEPGEAVCSLCRRGSYSNISGAVECSSCGGLTWTTSKAVLSGASMRWIELEGAASAEFCHCVPGRYFWHGKCELCSEGASCEGSGMLELLPGYHSTERDCATSNDV